MCARYYLNMDCYVHQEFFFFLNSKKKHVHTMSLEKKYNK